MSHTTIALVIAQPGPLRNSLLTLLSTLPEIEIVAEARDLATLKHISKDWQPDLIVLEANTTENGISEALRQIDRVWAKSRAVVLVDSKEQQQKAEAAGADAVLLKGFRAPCLVAIIEELIKTSVSESI